jgi:hypothetical protein
MNQDRQLQTEMVYSPTRLKYLDGIQLVRTAGWIGRLKSQAASGCGAEAAYVG